MGKYEDPIKRRARNRAYYLRNVARESQRSRAKTQKLIAWVKSFLLDYLLKHPCVDCGEKDPIVLEFDHRDPKQKLFTMAEARRAKKRPADVKAEVEKCDVRCANCHRRRTVLQQASGGIPFGMPIRKI